MTLQLHSCRLIALFQIRYKWTDHTIFCAADICGAIYKRQPIDINNGVWFLIQQNHFYVCSGTGKRFSKRKEMCCIFLLNAGFEPESLEPNQSPADWTFADKPTELSRIQLKLELNGPVSEHSAHSTPLPVGFRTSLWRYTCLLLVISKLWHTQAIFESKAGKMSSSAKYKIWTRVSGTASPTDSMPADKHLWCHM